MNQTTSLLCDAEDSTLLIVDIQTKLTGAMPMKVLARLQRNSGLLLKAAAALEIPVIATEQYPKGLGPLESEIVNLLPENSSRLEKTCFSSAGAEGFMDILKNNGRNQVVLIGIEAHICVLQTALDLKTKGFQVFVVTDAVCSRHRENYETAIQRLKQSGVITCDSESVVFEWLRDAKHKDFKMFSSMVR